MNKSVLIVDTPKKCEECILCLSSLDLCYISNGFEYIGRNIKEGNKPSWCPLKEIPKKYDNVSMNFERGYNACIDEILKEHD